MKNIGTKKEAKYGSILVTGCGGDISIGVARILRMENICSRIIGCDIHNDHPGEGFFDKCVLVPRADDKEYFNQLLNVIKNNDIDIIVLVTEPELKRFSENGFEKKIESVPVVMVNLNTLSIGLDKLNTADFLQKAGLAYPMTTIVSSGPPARLPCVIKSRSGSGSRNVLVVKKQELVEQFSTSRPDDIWQEYLSPDDEEYTCGVFRFFDGEVRTIVFKRKLQGGFTGSGVLVCNEQIDMLLQKIAKELRLQGSINVQLRLTEKGPIVFEINPRFSSTLVFRHLLGFQDVIWSLNELAGELSDTYITPNDGIRIYRCSTEILLPARKE